MPTRTFLDTGVLLAARSGVEPAASRAFALIGDPDREFVVSDILRLELLPMPSYHGQDEEREFFEEFFSLAVTDVRITPERTSSALKLAARYGMNACDALHIEVARESGAEEFITTEKTSKPFFRVREGTMTVLPLVPDHPGGT